VESIECLATIGFLRSMIARDDEQPAVVRDSPAGERTQTLFGRCGQSLCAREI
jgi:hypothetical protein